MAELVYGICAVVSFLCAVLLQRGFNASRHRLLLWAALCFWVLALNNALLFVDLVVIQDVDLSVLRRGTAALAPMLFLLGLIWGEDDR